MEEMVVNESCKVRLQTRKNVKKVCFVKSYVKPVLTLLTLHKLRENGTYFLLMWSRNNSKLTLTLPLNSEKDGRFSYLACRRSSIRMSSEAIRVATPSKVDSSRMVKTPAVFEDIVSWILSNCRGEYWSIDRRMPFS